MQIKTDNKTTKRHYLLPELKPDPAPAWPQGIILSDSAKIAVSTGEAISVVLSQNAFGQLFSWTYSTAMEISCLGSVSRQGGRFLVENFYLVKQAGSSVNTQLDQTALAELIEKLLAEGNRSEIERIKCWAHSHPHMEPFWSTTDAATCRLLATDYLISIVVAADFKARCRIDVTAPFCLTLDNVPIYYQVARDEIQLARYANEVQAAVTERPLAFLGRRDDFFEQEMSGLDLYCSYCGNWHADGDCPLNDPQKWPQVADDDFMF